MRSILFFLLISLLILPCCHAQQYLREGYVILQSGDTLKGFIDDKEWDINPGDIQFKTSIDDQAKTYTTAALTAFYTGRPAYYEGFTVRYDGDTWVTGKSYPATREPSIWVTAAVFLETLVKSEGLSLYKLGDPNGRNHFFIREGTGNLQELIFRQYQGMINSVSTVITSEQWKQQLINYGWMPCIKIENNGRALFGNQS